MRSIDNITGEILDAAIKIHRDFGPGMLESVYERMLEAELQKRGFVVETQKPISFIYEGMSFNDAFRIDLLVDGKVIVELKSTEKMSLVYHKQVKTYLKITGLQVGLLINFGMVTLKEGFVRVVNGLDPHDSILNVNLRTSAPPRDKNGVVDVSRGEAERRSLGDAVKDLEGSSMEVRRQCCDFSKALPTNTFLRTSAPPREINKGVLK